MRKRGVGKRGLVVFFGICALTVFDPLERALVDGFLAKLVTDFIVAFFKAEWEGEGNLATKHLRNDR